MTVTVHADHNIDLHESYIKEITATVETELGRVSDQTTQVEIHLSDQNANKSGPSDKKCMMQARLEGRQPFAVTCEASSLDQAIEGACGKMVRLLESRLARVG